MNSNSELSRLRNLTDQIKLEHDADRRFFERFPDRNYRVRRACQAERRHAVVAERSFPPLGTYMFVAMHQVAAGSCVRVVFVASSDRAQEPSEAESAALFQAIRDRSGDVVARELELENLVKARGDQ